MKRTLINRVPLCACFLAILVLSGCRTTAGPETSRKNFIVSQVAFTMIRVPAMDFPGGPLGTIGLPENRLAIISIKNDYWLAETNTTYELWETVYAWAIDHGYQFDRSGMMGTRFDGNGMTAQHPVTAVDWISAAVWCNALTELYNAETGSALTQVYEHNGRPIKACIPRENENSIIARPGADGFRLPTGFEWELAARYSSDKADDTYREYPPRSGRYWAPFLNVSGEIEYKEDMAERGGNVEYGSVVSKPVLELKPNDLGFTGFAGKDGKLWQWCYEFLLYRPKSGDSFHLKRGGSRAPRCGRHEYWPRNKEERVDETCNGYDQITFRVTKNG